MDPLHLIRTAKKLARGRGGKPQQADLRRAISTAYYALFHCVANAYADALIGTNTKTRNDMAWNYAYRSITHTKVAQSCKKPNLMTQLPAEIQDFAGFFRQLQSLRYPADYNPGSSFIRSEVLKNINLAEDVILGFKKCKIHERKAFAAFVTANLRRS